VRELFTLIRDYGPDAVAQALIKAHAAGAFGADYIANILRQQQVRRDIQPRMQLKDRELNELVTDPLSLAEYDAFILRSRKDSHDPTPSERLNSLASGKSHHPQTRPVRCGLDDSRCDGLGGSLHYPSGFTVPHELFHAVKLRNKQRQPDCCGLQTNQREDFIRGRKQERIRC
jgi:hypothetical protein